MRVKEYMDDVFSQAIKPGRSCNVCGDKRKRDNLGGRLESPIAAQPRLLIANIVIKGRQWGRPPE